MKYSLLHATKKWVIKYDNINTKKTLKLWQTYNRQKWNMLLQKWPLVISTKFYRNHLQLENRLLKQSKCISNKILLKTDMLIIFFHLVAGSALQVFSHRNQLIFQWFKNDAHQVLQSHPEHETRYRRHQKPSELQLFYFIFIFLFHFHWWVTCSLLSLPSLHRCCWFAFESPLNSNLSQRFGPKVQTLPTCVHPRVPHNLFLLNV